MEQIEQFMGSKAMNPADVACQVVYAIRTNQFWVITHAATQRRLTGRNARLQALENPKMEP
jgi:meiotically up-regulated gene 157 (Mug157) protein